MAKTSTYRSYQNGSRSRIATKTHPASFESLEDRALLSGWVDLEMGSWIRIFSFWPRVGNTIDSKQHVMKGTKTMVTVCPRLVALVAIFICFPTTGLSNQQVHAGFISGSVSTFSEIIYRDPLTVVDSVSDSENIPAFDFVPTDVGTVNAFGGAVTRSALVTSETNPTSSNFFGSSTGILLTRTVPVSDSRLHTLRSGAAYSARFEVDSRVGLHFHLINHVLDGLSDRSTLITATGLNVVQILRDSDGNEIGTRTVFNSANAAYPLQTLQLGGGEFIQSVDSYGHGQFPYTLYSLDPGEYVLSAGVTQAMRGVLRGRTANGRSGAILQWGINGLPGSNPLFPVMPTVHELDGFVFDTISSDDVGYYDPEIATGYDYTTDGTPFASVLVPDALPGGDSLFDLIVGDNRYALAAGQLFDFTSLFPEGVTEFGIRGINAAEGLDPNDPAAFVTGLSFVRGGEVTSFRMTPVTEETNNVVPEPGSLALLAMGAVCLLGYHCRRRRSKQGV